MKTKGLNIPLKSLCDMLEDRGFLEMEETATGSRTFVGYVNPRTDELLLISFDFVAENFMEPNQELVTDVKRTTLTDYKNKNWENRKYCQTLDEVLNGN